MDRVRVTPRVGEVHLQPIRFGAADRRSRDRPVVGPRSEVYARRDLDFPIHRGDLVFPLNLAVRERRYAAVVESPEECGGIETVRIHVTAGSRESWVVCTAGPAELRLVVPRPGSRQGPCSGRKTHGSSHSRSQKVAT